MKVFLSFGFFLLLSPLLVDAFVFRQNLGIGSVGPEVLELQRALNRNSETVVSVSGPGSPGQETSYFGKATHQAVIKFQEKYMLEILSPLGLSQGTGYAGKSTRAKINQMISGF